MLLEIPLNFREGCLYLQISSHVEKMILAGTLAPGTRLPGTRGLGEALGVSRSTVMEAYARLCEKGLVIQCGRSGTYVASVSPQQDAGTSAKNGFFVMDSELPSRDLIPLDPLWRAARDVLLPPAGDVLAGSPPEGLPELRKALLCHAVLRGIPAKQDEVVVTSGGKDALSTVLRALRGQGRLTVWAEELSYSDIGGIAKNEGLSLRTIPLLAEESLHLLAGLGVKDVLYLVPSFQNPTGRTIVQHLRREILALQEKQGFLIIEDDSYGELRYGEKSIPALKAVEGGEEVVFVGSFSQVLFPGMRFGYILLPSGLKEDYLRVASFRQGHTSSLVQAVMRHFIENGGLASALGKARDILSGRMRALCTALKASFPFLPVYRPEGGMYLWLPTGGLASREAAARAAGRKVLVTPGDAFALEGKDPLAVRLSLSSVPAERMQDAVSALEKAFRGIL